MHFDTTLLWSALLIYEIVKANLKSRFFFFNMSVLI